MMLFPFSRWIETEKLQKERKDSNILPTLKAEKSEEI